MQWKVAHLEQFGEVRHRDGLAHFGFHDTFGNQYTLSHDDHWIVCLAPNGDIKWSAGNIPVETSPHHLNYELQQFPAPEVERP